MVSFIPPPDPRSLLPPLLACLPTSFTSPRPPPALLTLLSPILRQRLHLLASTSDTWLSLLCWDPEAGTQLVDLVSESDAFELHPVSGEIDFGEIEPITYRRLDEETLQATIIIPDMSLQVIYLWCQGNDAEGETGWKVGEVLPEGTSPQHGRDEWHRTMTEANDKVQGNVPIDRELVVPTSANGGNQPTQSREIDDDDYWAQYDTTPGGRSSHAKPSPAPAQGNSSEKKDAAESDYFARYSSVQPEMDNDDPSQDRRAIGESSLNGDALTSPKPVRPQANGFLTGDASATVPDHPANGNAVNGSGYNTTGPQRSQSFRIDASTAELAIKQHVGSSIKSLFRLCKNSGMEREDFEELVQTELQTLSLIAEDD